MFAIFIHEAEAESIGFTFRVYVTFDVWETTRPLTWYTVPRFRMNIRVFIYMKSGPEMLVGISVFIVIKN